MDKTIELFSELNECEYLEALEVGETKDLELRILIAEMMVTDEKPPRDPNDAVDKVLRDATLIKVTDNSRLFEVIFSDYIGYSVLNESYTQFDKSQEFEGGLARIYKKSKFLEYLVKGTFATDDYPGPFKHYGFCCADHIINVASTSPPIIKRLK